jgi:hypothetical protein
MVPSCASAIAPTANNTEFRMAEESKATERFSLSRWSRRKLEAARADPPAPDVASAPPAAVPASSSPAVAPVPTPVTAPAESERPQVETLTFDSDFRAFLKPDVDPATQRAALKKLFSDPRFNVMDGLDTYIDDYTQADPMPAGMLDKLGKVYALLKEDAPGAQSTKAEEVAASTESAAPCPIEAATPVAEVPASPIPAAAEPEKHTPE